MCCVHALHPCTAYGYMGRGRAFALVSLRSAVSAARQAYVVHPWHRACMGATCQLERCMPTDTWHVAGRMPRGMLHGILHGDSHRRMATATWHVVWRLPRGMSYGECFMFQSSSCTAAVRSVLPGHPDRPKSEGRLQVGYNRQSTHAMLADESCTRTTSRDRAAQPCPSYFVSPLALTLIDRRTFAHIFR